MMLNTRAKQTVRLTLEALEARDVPTGALTALSDPTPVEQAKHFGEAVARSDRYLVVGAPGDSTAGPLAGAVDVYNAGTGALIRRITNPAPASMDEFGAAVAVSGDLVVVGAPFDDAAGLNAGAAYVFNAASGALLRTFTNPARTAGDTFGTAVAIDGNRVVVGAPWHDGPVADTGAAYLFDTVTGNLLATLGHSNVRAGEQFGAAVAIAGPRIVVSAPYADPLATVPALYAPGAVFFYSSAAPGAPTATVVNPNAGSGSLPGPAFGAALAAWQPDNPKLNGLAVVGAPYYTTAPGQGGSAYILDLASGTVRGRLFSPTPTINDAFGSAVGVSDRLVIVGARQDDAGATDAGSAYLFDAGKGQFVTVLRNPAPEAGDRFGAAVAVWGSEVVVGTPEDNRSINPLAGAAYATGLARPPTPAVQHVAPMLARLSLDGGQAGGLVRGGFRRVKGNRLRRTFTLRNDGLAPSAALRVVVTQTTRGFKPANRSVVLPSVAAGQSVTFSLELIRQPSALGKTPAVALAFVLE
jgi:hypothetical protein